MRMAILEPMPPLMWGLGTGVSGALSDKALGFNNNYTQNPNAGSDPANWIGRVIPGTSGDDGYAAVGAVRFGGGGFNTAELDRLAAALQRNYP